MEDKRGYRSTEILFKHDGDLTPVQGKREGRRPLRLQCSSEDSSAAWRSLPTQHRSGRSSIRTLDKLGHWLGAA